MKRIQTAPSAKPLESFWRDLAPGFAVILGVSAVLVWISFRNYLLFHVPAEFFAVGVAIIMFIVAWHTYRFSRNHFLMYLGCGYFWIAWLDVAHTLLYFGMPTALDDGNYTSQFWIVTRFLEALLLLSAPLFMDRPLRRGKVVALFGAVAVIAAFLVLGHYVPPTFVPGKGLTPFKVTGEYVIIAVMLAAIVHLYWRRHLIEPRILYLMLASISLTIGAELAFTFYVHMYGLSNLIGHIFKLFSFWLIYVAIIRTTLAEPFAVMARGSSTYNAVPDPTLLLGSDGIIHQVNRAACTETGLAEAELIGRSCHALFHPPGGSAKCPLCQALARGGEIPPLDLDLGGARGWRQFTLTPVWGEEYGSASVQVSSDITERKRAEAALLRSNEELRQYAGVAAHQLQEPLRLIASYAQLLSKHYKERLDKDADEFIGYIVGGAGRMQRLLAGLLVYTEAGTGTIKPVDCEKLLEEVRQALEPRIEAGGAVIEHGPLPVVNGNRRELHEVFFHLLGNALNNAGERPPHVQILADREEDGSWRFCVRDQGTGIAARHHERIFGLFVRLQGPAEGEGTGIGLALCKKIIGRYGGRIWVESEEGRGASFYFTLP